MQFDFNKFSKLAKLLTGLNRSHNSKDTKRGFNILKDNFQDLKILKTKSGTVSNFWVAPKQWEVIRAKLKDSKKRTIIDWKKNGPMCLYSFSKSFKGILNWKELDQHLLYDPKRPDSYIFHFRNQYRHWNREWGFSLPYNKIKKIQKNQKFFVDIKTTFKNDFMLNSILKCKGSSNKSICFVSHFDHAGQLSDGLGACLFNNLMIEFIKKKYKKTKYSYLALSTIEIIGSHFFVKKYSKSLNIKEALSINTVGIKSQINYSKSFSQNSIIDRIINKISIDKNLNINFSNFRDKMGADEIAFDAAGVNIPCGLLFRWPFKEYHSSKDNLSAVKKNKITELFYLVRDVVDILEEDYVPILKYKGLICLSNPDLDLYIDRAEVSSIKQNIKLDSEYQKFKKINLNNSIVNVSRIIDNKLSLFEISEKLKIPFKLTKVICDNFYSKKIISKKKNNLI